MNIAVFGASGKTGQQVVREALARGHRVVAVCRNKPLECTFPDGVEVKIADLMHGEQVQQALEGTQAVICVIGPRLAGEVFCAQATRNIIQGMKQWGIPRLLCLTGAMIGDYPAQRTVFMQWMANQFRKQNPQGAQDRAKQEEAVMTSHLQWTLVKPPRLSDGPPRGHYQAGEHLRVGMLSSLTRADLAAFLLSAAENNQYSRQRVFVCN